jgi:hypothetical protein
LNRIIAGTAALSLLSIALSVAMAQAQPAPTKGVDKAGRHYVLTLTVKLAKKDLPPDDAMEHAASDVGAYMLNACGAPGISRCDVYAGYDDKLSLPPGYIIAVTSGGATSYKPEFMNRAGAAPRFSCVADGKMPPEMTGKDVLEGKGPVVLLRDGAGIKLNYNKAYGCKVEVDDRFVLVGSMVFEH